MKQKLSLSCCLVHHPEVLLLDEPTFGVDPISRRELWLILHEMVREGVTILVSTSYLDEAERCDRVILLSEGKVLALDAPATLQSSLAGTLMAVRSGDPRAARDILRASPFVESAALFGDTVHAILSPGVDAAGLVGALERGGVGALDVHAVEPSLEDVFIQRTSMAAATRE
jgi:ABC-2 type transport system ATP-binding protein